MANHQENERVRPTTLALDRLQGAKSVGQPVAAMAKTRITGPAAVRITAMANGVKEPVALRAITTPAPNLALEASMRASEAGRAWLRNSAVVATLLGDSMEASSHDLASCAVSASAFRTKKRFVKKEAGHFSGDLEGAGVQIQRVGIKKGYGVIVAIDAKGQIGDRIATTIGADKAPPAIPLDPFKVELGANIDATVTIHSRPFARRREDDHGGSLVPSYGPVPLPRNELDGPVRPKPPRHSVAVRGLVF